MELLGGRTIIENDHISVGRNLAISVSDSDVPSRNGEAIALAYPEDPSQLGIIRLLARLGATPAEPTSDKGKDW